MPYQPIFPADQFRAPTTHYIITISGKRILYAYIRKNACSSFKRLINRNLHPFFILNKLLGREKNSRYNINGNMKYYQIDRFSYNKMKYDETIFVYRDPLPRFISVFTNKFIDNSGSIDIRYNFEKLTGITLENATFLDFIKYSEHDFSILDCHMWPQKSYLWDIEYSLPIRMDQLTHSMAECIGKEESNTWFEKKINASMSSGKAIPGLLHDVTVSDLRNLQDQGYAINKNNFIIDCLEDFIRSKYYMDFDMIESLDKT